MKKVYLLIAFLLCLTYANAQYCIPVGNDSGLDFITDVEVNTITNTSGAAGYSDFTATTFVALKRTLTYPISVTKNSTDIQGIGVWIDYNQDDDFDDAGELVYNNPSSSVLVASGSFTVPVTALGGTTRMRVMLEYSFSPGVGDACRSGIFGEVEDYTVEIEPLRFPGDVNTNLQLWLKGDAGTSVTGTDVDNWLDQSPNAFIGASEGTTDAQLVTDGLNFNPVLRFTGTQFLNIGDQPELDLQPDTDEMTILTVVVNGATSTGTIISKADEFDRNYQVWFGVGDRVLHHTLGRASSASPDTSVRYGTIHALNEPKITSGVVANTGSSLTRLTPYMNGVVDAAAFNEGTNTGSLTADILVGARRVSGNTGSGFLYSGDIAEVIIFDRDLTTTELQKVQSYLAIKYGITLGANEATSTAGVTTPSGYAGTSQNYLDSSGNIVWNGATNAGYGYNVFGVARDDDSDLMQTQSSSVNIDVTDVLTIEVESGSFPSDDSYLIVGNNGLAETIQTSTLPARTLGMLNKIWLARETATDVGSVELEFDMSASGILNLDDLELYVADGTSFSNYENYEGTNVGGVLTFTGINLTDGQYFTLAEPEVVTGSNALFFDGIDDYVEDKTPATQGLTNYTVMGWVKNPGQASTVAERRILGVTGQFRFFLDSDLLSIQEGQTISISSAGSDITREWVHFAVIVNSSTGFARFYLNGKSLGGGSVDPLPGNTNPFRMGTQSNVNFFEGSIDEVKIFNVALTETQMQEMIYQEIEQNGLNVRGTVIPKDIEDFTTSANVPWSSLVAYYDMSDIKGNRLADVTSNDNFAFMKNISSVEPQTAPMPYVTTADGSWEADATWVNGTIWDTPSASSRNWSIVRVQHDVDINANYTTLGLFVDAGNRLTVNGTNPVITNPSPFAFTAGSGFSFTNTWYTDLDGILDLNGSSQFVQQSSSDLEVTSAGYLEKDQQGTANQYTYNYWGSPVSDINAIANNQDFTLEDVFLDGTTPSAPVTITWTPNENAAVGPPITLSTRWIYKFINGADEDYDAWQFVRETGAISAGEGFTLKGTSSVANVRSEQNYVFRGKPNNGDITISPLGDDNLYLVGNPYPSALDANEFINDNIANNATSGTLYFWEHWGGGTHTLLDYQGGYATYTLGGATPAPSHPSVNQTGSGAKTPKQYIPVGQGFFVQGDSNAGNGVTATVEFNNSQRLYLPEYIAIFEFSTFMRGANTADPTATGIFTNPENGNATTTTETPEDDASVPDEIYEEYNIQRDERQKIRLGYTNLRGFHRQLLLTFDTNSTDAVDLGYEGESIGVIEDDMYWPLENKKYVIQAVQDYYQAREVAIGLISENGGTGTISIDQLEYIDSSVNIYIKDNTTGTTHDLRASDFSVTLPAGETNNRYSLVFSPENPLSVEDQILENGITMYTDTETKEIVITNNTNVQLEGVDMHTILGQQILSLKEGMNENTIRIPIEDKASGIYIISIYSENGKISKKLVVQ